MKTMHMGGKQNIYLVLFVDVTGDNTLQKNDGNIGGQKFVVENNQ